MSERAEDIQAFLQGTPWAGSEVLPLAADASFRIYRRVVGGPEPAVLMDVPPEKEDTRAFVRVAEHLLDMGFSAPRIFARDEALGFLLLEDFGDATFTKLLRQGADETRFYDRATDLLCDLHDRAENKALPEWFPPYDRDVLMKEALLLPDWFLPAAGTATAPSVRDDYIAAWDQVFPKALKGPKTLVLRDYHVDNIIFLEDRPGFQALGLLDFQDALAGHPAYDLMSLLEDARRDVGEELTARQLARYQEARSICNRDDFTTAYAVLGAGRHAKVIGIFTRLMVRDRKPAYLKHVPRVWRLLERSLDHPALEPVRRWMDAHVPKSLRSKPILDESGR